MKKNDFFSRVDAIKEKMYKIAYSYSNSESMAIDAIDEAVYQGYIKRKQLRQDIYFETWIIRILINVCTRQYRDSKKYAEYDEACETFSEESISNLPLKLAVEKLPLELRSIILLKFFGGYKTVEIAEILDTPQGTVATRLRKALSLLKIELEES